ncbi:MAG: FtsX-like permease family protein [Clostridiales bacterium]|nr:FtsX-like permease family protein [Clostridiales bacterium]
MRSRPFSAWTYIRNNLARSLVLMLMMSFITVCFIGGMYVDNPIETFRVSKNESDRYIICSLKGNNSESIEEYEKLYTEIKGELPENLNEVIYVNSVYYDFDSIMFFNCQMQGFYFTSVEDFELFKERTHLVPDDLVLNNMEVAMSEQLANNEGLSIGDSVNSKKTIHLAKTFKGDGMRVYGVADVSYGSRILILGSDGVCDEDLEADIQRTVQELSAKYPLCTFETASSYVGEVEEEMGFMYFIFAVIVILVAIVLLVTINAVFTAAYDKRKHEFAIYKALGFTRGQIFRKIASEVLILNAGAFILGMVINAGVILVVNQCMWGEGQHFYRVTSSAVIGTLISEVVVITTIILLNWRKVRKCEVTEE